ncbi:LIM homeobox transcription factor 1-beta isoform X2 [Venturia canescens]|uniref:LIM homeobox transcription factor 1-beta isoform X2 n=1 Tax=Venturia canescens TaxID=32260 RepID=UPI001C9C62DE|nr:LIM homeobox transcription factor 1-beta isoform X2 [Venturia canescens]
MIEFYPSSLAATSTLNHQDGGPGIGSTSSSQFRPTAMVNDHANPSATVKTECGSMKTICAGCGHGISDRYIMRVSEKNYHEDCLACAECGRLLSYSCYTRDDLKLYCRPDYERIFRAKCARCGEKLSRSDLVIKHEPLIFHEICFACCICGQTLLKGAQYLFRQGQPICRRDFEHDLFLNCSQDDDILDENRPRDGRRGPKRPRTILTSAQRRQFKASFELSPKPCRKVREALAKETGLSVRVVQVWFQNQRAKMKKQQRKAKTEPGTEKEAKEERRLESPHSDHSHYLNALNMRDAETSSFPLATQPLDPNNPYSPDDAYPGNSGESFCSSDLSQDGTEAGFDIGDSESRAAPDGHHASSLSHGGSSQEAPSLSQSLHVAIHNPIDKLFMMQSSYFSGDHS